MTLVTCIRYTSAMMNKCCSFGQLSNICKCLSDGMNYAIKSSCIAYPSRFCKSLMETLPHHCGYTWKGCAQTPKCVEDKRQVFVSL